MNTSIPKQYLQLAGKPILAYTAEQFQSCDLVDCIIIVAADQWRKEIGRWKDRYALTKIRAVAPAGQSRQESILNGLLAGREFSEGERDGVIVQDAARPLTSPILIENLLDGLREAPAVMPALPVTDTVYASADGQWVNGLLDRSTLYAGQAPEAFNYKWYLKLYSSAAEEALSTTSGSCQLPYQAGWKVKIIPGERNNIKVTYQEDLALCERILEERGRLQ